MTVLPTNEEIERVVEEAVAGRPDHAGDDDRAVVADDSGGDLAEEADAVLDTEVGVPDFSHVVIVSLRILKYLVNPEQTKL